MYVPHRLGRIPAIGRDELLSSFLIRLAHKHKLNLHTFCSTVFPGHEFWTRDIDRCSNMQLINDISRKTGLDSSVILEMTLRPFMMIMDGRICRNGISKWILPLGVFHRTRGAFGQQYCSECLVEREPICLRAWRLAFNIHCPIHNISLRDCCPNCGVPFHPHRNGSLINLKCHVCSNTLISSAASRTCDGALIFQKELQTALYSDSVSFHEFNSWHRLLSIIARNDQRFAGDLGGWFQWRLMARSRLFEFAITLKQNWPNSFVLWAEAHRLSQAGLNDFEIDLGWLKEAVMLLPERYSPIRKARNSVRREKILQYLRMPKGVAKSILREKILLDDAFSVIQKRRSAKRGRKKESDH